MGGANPETNRDEQSFGCGSWSCPHEQENYQQVAMEGESMLGIERDFRPQLDVHYSHADPILKWNLNLSLQYAFCMVTILLLKIRHKNNNHAQALPIVL